jgi:hypothetical protein
MAIDISKLNETQLTALMAKIQARLQELQLEKVSRVRDKVIAMITSEGLGLRGADGTLRLRPAQEERRQARQGGSEVSQSR